MKTNLQQNRYTKKLQPNIDDDIYTVAEWGEAIKNGEFGNYDGNGYWLKDGYRSDDEVFSTPQLDATHVIWFNK